MPTATARHQPVSSIPQYQAYHTGAAVTNATPIGQPVNTTSSTSVGAPGSVVITPAAGGMANIFVGMLLAIYGGTGTGELVTVTAITSTTFTATFANTHSGTYNITSVRGVDLGPVIFNQLGSGMTLTLYNGNPDAGILAGFATTPPNYGPIGVITPASAPFPYAVACDYGLYVKYTGTTAGDVTVHYRPQG